MTTRRPGKLRTAMSQGDVYAAECPSRSVLDHVMSKWGVLVLVGLLEGTHRFSELRRKISGISEKMLAQTLQTLEQDGFVRREVHPVIPPHVDYSLTPLGTGVAEHIEQITDWIEDNLHHVLAARKQPATKRPTNAPRARRVS